MDDLDPGVKLFAQYFSMGMLCALGVICIGILIWFVIQVFKD